MNAAGGPGPWALARDPENAVLFGVCAGIARRLAIRPWGIRLVMVVALVLFTLPMAVAYVTAAVLLPRRGLAPMSPEQERRFWRQAADEARFEEARFEQEEWI